VAELDESSAIAMPFREETKALEHGSIAQLIAVFD
jgi:hypothetical protein